MNSIDLSSYIDKEIPQKSYWYFFFKRLSDIILASFLFVLLFPLMTVIYFAVRYEMKGSAVLKQKRVGQNGKIFDCYKFRTMKNHEDESSVTPRSKFLRQTSLDELPQLINVLIGNMSLVGPRPELVSRTQEYKNWQKKRHIAKPGITGFWQINGRKNIPLSENIEYDIYYLHKRSLIFDLYIILKTPFAVLNKNGAY